MSTVAVVDDGRAEILRPGTGTEMGFERYIEVNPGPVAAHDDSTTVTQALAVLERPAGSRLFLWVHFFGVHSPSERHRGVTVYGDSVADRYDHEVRYFDIQLARLLAALDHRSTPTAVFLTADHGEELGAYTRHHGYSVAEDVIRVPLIARVPGWPVGESDTLVSLVDLMPTILALTQTPAPSGLDGQDLRVLLAGPDQPSRVLLSDTWRFDVEQRLVADFVAAYDGRNKLLIDELEYGSYLYDARKPNAEPVLRFDPAADRLSKIAYGYLEQTGGMPLPTD
jgi:arylsulfatase A-like enzyme